MANKLKSRFERLFLKRPIGHVRLSSVPTFVKSQVVKDGVVSSSVELKDVSPVDAMRQYKVSDFVLANILAVGGDRFLQPTQYSSQPADVASQFEKIPESAFVAPTASNSTEPTNPPSAK